MATTMHVSDVAELLSEGRTHFNLSPTLLKKIQKRLAELKFLSGNVDGVFGADTRAAIRSYQASVGHPQGNFLTAQDRNMLLTSNGPSAPKQTATTTQPAPGTSQQTPITPQQTPVAAPQTPATAPASASETATGEIGRAHV